MCHVTCLFNATGPDLITKMNRSDFRYGCSLENPRNLVLFLVLITFALIIFSMNLFVSIVYLKNKDKKWTFLNILTVIFLFNNIFGGLFLFLPSSNLCYELICNFAACLLEYCVLYFLGLNYCVLNLIISLEKLIIIKFNTGFITRFNLKNILIACGLFIFLLLFLLATSPILFNWNNFNNCECSFNHSLDKSYVLLNNSILLIFTFITMSIYLFIFQIVKKIQNNIFILDTSDRVHQTINSQITKLKALKTQALLFVIFFICWIPFITISVYDINREFRSYDTIALLRNFLICPILLCSIIVPIVLSIRVSFIKRIFVKKKISNLRI